MDASQQTALAQHGAGHASLLRTEYGVPPVSVASEVEDVRVVSSNDGQSVMDAGQETCPADGSVHFHGFVQSLLGLAFVVPVINAAP